MNLLPTSRCVRGWSRSLLPRGPCWSGSRPVGCRPRWRLAAWRRSVRAATRPTRTCRWPSSASSCADSGELQRIDASDLPAKAMRLRACTAAYDYVLLECCRTLEVPVPATRTPLTQSERFNAEVRLLAAGFSW